MQLLYLKYVRLRLDRSQLSVGNEAGIDQKMLSMFERGRAIPTDDELDRLARELNVPADMLLMPVEVELPVVQARGYLRPSESETVAR